MVYWIKEKRIRQREIEREDHIRRYTADLFETSTSNPLGRVGRHGYAFGENPN
jgi:hypothetical protein